MAMPLEKLDYSAEYKEIQPSLFRESEVLDTLLETIFSVCDKQQEDLLWISQNLLNIDAAEGSQLDFIGNIVGQPRLLSDFNTEPYFGYDGSYQSKTFGSSTDQEIGGYWNSRSYFNTATSRKLNDDEYRRLIKARVIYNQSNCTANDLLEVINLITNSKSNTVQMLKHGLVQINSDDSTGILSYFVDRLLMMDNILPIAAGVRVGLESVVGELIPEIPNNELSSVTIIGTAKVGETLTANVTDANGIPNNITYQWFASGVSMLGAIFETFILNEAQVGKAITVEVTFTDNDGYVESVTSIASTPILSKIPTDYILRYDFNGDVLDKSESGLDGVKSGNVIFVEGRKTGTQAAKFTNGVVGTEADMTYTTNKITFSFWMKTAQTDFSCLLHSMHGVNNYSIFLNNNAGALTLEDRDTVYTEAVWLEFTKSNWVHVIAEIDRGNITNKVYQAIYVNNGLPIKAAAVSGKNSSIFGSGKISIGMRHLQTDPFVGELQDLRVFNRLLTAEERTALFNE